MISRRRVLIAFAVLLAAARDVSSAEPPTELSRWLGPQTWEKDTAGPIVSLGLEEQFDDMHIFAPAVAFEQGKFSLWYSGSRGTRNSRVFRLGLATSNDGKRFEKHAGNPVLEFADGVRSVLTPALLRNPDGSTLRDAGKLRLWFAAADLKKGGLHTLHESSSEDGIHWTEPSTALLENVYCPTVIKADAGYQMWFSDVSRRPWVLRHAASADGTRWNVTAEPVLTLSQPWEAEVFVYPTVVQVDGVYLMWYGSYYNSVRRQTTAIGFAASVDGIKWHKHPQNPVIKPDAGRPWESNYVGSGSVMRLPDGSFRYWYASRKAPPFENLYFAINTARWTGPTAQSPGARLRLPPQKGDVGTFEPARVGDARTGRSLDVLEVVDADDVVVRAWYADPTGTIDGPSFVDLWIHGIDTSALAAGKPANFSQSFRMTGSQSFGTTCGGRSLPLLEVEARGRD
jgi:hypothetical protein